MARLGGTIPFILLTLLSGGAVAAQSQPTAAGIEFFEAKIRPLLVENCYKCHSSSAEKLKANFRLDSHQGILKGGESGSPAIVPGDADGSPLIVAVRYEEEALQMPPKKKLAAEQIAHLEAWVKMGAPMPADQAPAVSATTKPMRMTLDEGRKFWSFQAPREPKVPSSQPSNWARNDIDRFISAKLSENGLAPSPVADRRTLIRRATFDLIGLPPTPQEIESFVNDLSPRAYENLIDRLLASPHYGERWARYWLDVARYADTKGYVFEEERRYAFSYTYRDWVVRVFNEDLAYDQFLIQQIAADKLELKEDKRPLAALGFLTLGRRFLNNQHDIIDDRIDVVTRGTMALTVTCARCHDHKYDPIPTADYYSLYGVFASATEPKESPLIGGEKPAQLAEFDVELAKRKAEIEQFKKTKLREYVINLKSADQITQYLLAAQKGLTPQSTGFETVDDGKSLNAWLVQRWQSYLNAAAAKNDPVFGVWRSYVSGATTKPLAVANQLVDSQIKGAKTLQEVAQRYGSLLSKHQWLGASSDPAARELQTVVNSADFPTAVKLDEVASLFNRADQAEQNKLIEKMESLIATHPGSPPRAMVLEDLPEPSKPHIFKRGNSASPGDEVPRQFLAILSPDARLPFKDSGRLELARKIASKDNPLTARVIVNRVWQYHFGLGLVRTPSDFGTRGEPPTHPELLDYLALRFTGDDAWSIKKLHKRIMLSAAYQQSSLDNSIARAKDPENRLVWRMNPCRLDFEAMRDSLLATSGQLDLKLGGRSVDILAQPFVPRRSIYAYIDRQNLPGMFRTFDFASPDTHSGQRFITSVPQQALFMMNSPFVIEQSRKLAARPELAKENDPQRRIAQLHRLTLGRDPTAEETSLALRFIQSEEAQKVEVAQVKPSTWQYGFGEFDESAQRIKQLQKLKHFTGSVYQGGPELPNPKTGWAMLTASGGHAGNDAQHAVVRRWTAPRDCTVAVKGKLSHNAKEGDGVRARLVTSRDGLLATWIVHRKDADTTVTNIDLKQNDTVDFIVDCRASVDFDSFDWPVTITKEPAAAAVAGDDTGSSWNSVPEFTGPPPANPLNPWEKYAQVLLESNEFLFVD